MCMGDGGAAESLRKPSWQEAMNTIMAMDRYQYAKENLEPTVKNYLADVGGNQQGQAAAGKGMAAADVAQKLPMQGMLNPKQGAGATPALVTAEALIKSGRGVDTGILQRSAGEFENIANQGRSVANTAQRGMGEIAAHATEQAIYDASQKFEKKQQQNQQLMNLGGSLTSMGMNSLAQAPIGPTGPRLTGAQQVNAPYAGMFNQVQNQPFPQFEM